MIQVKIGVRGAVIADFPHPAHFEQPEPFVFTGQAHCLAGFARLPGTKGPGLVVIGLDRPVPAHVDDFGHQAQTPLAIHLQPETGPAGGGKIAPGKALFLPQAVVLIASRFDKLQELAIRNQVSRGLECRDSCAVAAVLVIPAVDRVVLGFADLHPPGWNLDQTVFRGRAMFFARSPGSVRSNIINPVLADQH